MSQVYGNYTYSWFTDVNGSQKIRSLLDKYSPGQASIPLSALLDQMLGMKLYQSRTIYVDQSAPTGGNGSEKWPYQSIDSANAELGSTPGGTVKIRGGYTTTGMVFKQDISYDFTEAMVFSTGAMTLDPSFVAGSVTIIGLNASFTLSAGSAVTIPNNCFFLMIGPYIHQVVTYDHTFATIQSGGALMVTGNFLQISTGGSIAVDCAGSMELGGGGTIENDSNTLETVKLTGSAEMNLSGFSRVRNRGSAVSLNMVGGNVQTSMSIGCQIATEGGGKSIIKDTAASELSVVPQTDQGQNLFDTLNGTYAAGEIRIGKGAQMGYVAGNPSGARTGVPGQIVEDTATGNKYICQTGTVWAAI